MDLFGWLTCARVGCFRDEVWAADHLADASGATGRVDGEGRHPQLREARRETSSMRKGERLIVELSNARNFATSGSGGVLDRDRADPTVVVPLNGAAIEFRHRMSPQE